MILAAGFGTRLGEMTQHRPKPMLPIAGVPLVRWAAQWLRHYGVRDIVVNLHHLGDQIEAELGDGSALGVNIQYSHEEGMILGTGGGLRQARPLLDDGSGEPIIVVNGKVMIDLDLGEVLAGHLGSGAEATMVLRPDPDASKWGSFRLDDNGRVVRFLDATPRELDEVPVAVSEPLMFTGVHVMQPRFLDRIPPEGEQCIIRTAYKALFHEGRGLQGHVSRSYWWEHSTPERYRQGVFNLLSGRIDPQYATGAVRGVHPAARLHPQARIVSPVHVDEGAVIEAGATVGPFAQVGRDAVIREGVCVERSIVWDRAEVTHDCRDTVVVG
jgi:NDP-sugar pyrophosphorylase family protein